MGKNSRENSEVRGEQLHFFGLDILGHLIFNGGKYEYKVKGGISIIRGGIYIKEGGIPIPSL